MYYQRVSLHRKPTVQMPAADMERLARKSILPVEELEEPAPPTVRNPMPSNIEFIEIDPEDWDVEVASRPLVPAKPDT